MVTFQVHGERLGEKSANLLGVVCIFKGKLRAAATRGKHSDSVDLLYLEGLYLEMLQKDVQVFNLQYVGLALKRNPHLRYAFHRIGIDVQAAEEQTQSLSLTGLPPPVPGDVQRGIMG